MTRANSIQLFRSGSNSSIPTTLSHCTSSRARNLRTDARSFSATTELLISTSPVRYLLHTALLTTQSPYFRAALTPDTFLESSTNSISLPDIEASIFELLVNWLYTGRIHPVPFKDGKPAYYTLLHLWILADRLNFEGLRNSVVDVVAECADQTNSVLTPSDTRILYEQIPDSASGEKIRDLVLDLFAFKETERLLKEHQDRWHAAFLRHLVLRLKRPCAQGLARHTLRMWIPDSWNATRACEGCRSILPPRYGAVGCEECSLGWCIRCVSQGTSSAGWEDGRARLGIAERAKGRRWESCKPWRASRCRVYHEHGETERCGDVCDRDEIPKEYRREQKDDVDEGRMEDSEWKRNGVAWRTQILDDV